MRPAEVRFWEKVHKTRTCWLWTGARLMDGYGAFKMPNGKTYGAQKRAHRIAWTLTYGDVLDKQQVLHTCDNPLCVRPEHLFLGTCADNMADKVVKGRSHAKRTRLTEQDVRDIRVAVQRRSYRAVARQYGVRHAVIGRIARRMTYVHIK